MTESAALLSSFERDFCREFAKDYNPELAAIRVGSDPLLAADMAYELVGRQEIIDYTAECVMEARYSVTALNNLKPEDYGINEAYIMIRLKDISYKGKYGEQLKALELMGKQIGMFKGDTAQAAQTFNVFDDDTRRALLERISSKS